MSVHTFIPPLVMSAMLAFVLVLKLKIPARHGLIIAFISGTAAMFAGICFATTFTTLIIEGLIIGVCALILILTLFFRDPDRISPETPGLIISPADGQVRYVKRVTGGQVPVSEKQGRFFRLDEMLGSGLLTEGVLIIGIEMNIINVHVNRAPLSGRIVMQKPVPGKFLSLRDLNAVFQNERLTTILEHGRFKVGVVQIASRAVRRIVSYKQEGEHLARGERFGMIKFGSQVDVILPELPALKIEVREGDRVKAGESIIASYDADG